MQSGVEVTREQKSEVPSLPLPGASPAEPASEAHAVAESDHDHTPAHSRTHSQEQTTGDTPFVSPLQTPAVTPFFTPRSSGQTTPDIPNSDHDHANPDPLDETLTRNADLALHDDPSQALRTRASVARRVSFSFDEPTGE